MTITEFLNARLDEDEAVALDVDPDARAEALDAITSEHYETWRFLLDQTPARVLAEVEAKRMLVSLANIGCGDDYERVRKALALPYADHPDYDEAWRP